MKNNKKKLNNIYCNLEKYFGDLGWWPAENNFEVIVGAILVQNASWNNVSKVISKLKKSGALTPGKILGMKNSSLANIIKPVGFFKIKAERLQNVIKFFYKENSIRELKKLDFETLRKKILIVFSARPNPPGPKRYPKKSNFYNPSARSISSKNLPCRLTRSLNAGIFFAISQALLNRFLLNVLLYSLSALLQNLRHTCAADSFI